MLTFAPVAIDDPRVAAVIRDMRDRQRRELRAANGDAALDALVEHFAVVALSGQAHKAWLVCSAGVARAVVIAALDSAHRAIVGMIATRAWEAGFPPLLLRWMKRVVLGQWLDGWNVAVAETEVVVFGDGAPRDTQWLGRLGFEAVSVDHLSVDVKRVRFERRHPRFSPAARKVA